MLSCLVDVGGEYTLGSVVMAAGIVAENKDVEGTCAGALGGRIGVAYRMVVAGTVMRLFLVYLFQKKKLISVPVADVPATPDWSATVLPFVQHHPPLALVDVLVQGCLLSTHFGLIEPIA